MKRSLKALLVAGATTAALAGPATPAHAATCVGFVYTTPGGLQNAGAWQCDPCPSQPVYFFDGRWHVIVCLPST